MIFGSGREEHGHDLRMEAVDRRAQPDPEHFGGHQFLDIDRGREDRIISALETLLYEGAEHGRQGENDRGGDQTGADKLDISDPRRRR